ncbi:MAG: thymidine phosphorylase, partial [Pseudomonadota bacterium]
IGDIDETSRQCARLVDVIHKSTIAALLTDMNEPLASAIGNAVEVQNAVDFLTGQSDDTRLSQVVLALAAEMVAACGAAPDLAAARTMTGEALSSGKAADIFGQMVRALGGPSDFMEKPGSYLPQAPIVKPLYLKKAATLSATDARAIGVAVVEMGGGRRTREDQIDHAVGLSGFAEVGTALEKDQPLCVIHARSQEQFDATAKSVLAACRFDAEVTPKDVVVIERID